MASTLQLEIVTPEKAAFSGTASQVILPAWRGQLGVLPEHDHLLALLRGGIAIVQTPAGDTRFVLGRGFAEIGPDRVTVLTDSCEAADTIDKAQATAELTELQREFDDANLYAEGADRLELRLELARARVEV